MPRTERNGETVFLLRTERNGTERNENGTIKKKKRKRNDSIEGPRSRTERNDFKKVGTCPALLITLKITCVILKRNTKFYLIS